MEFLINRNTRSRHIRIAVRHDGSVRVSAPKRVGDDEIKRLVASKSEWIKRTLMKIKKMTDGLEPHKPLVNRDEFVKQAEKMIRVWSSKLGVVPNKISIRKMRSRWGSCSRAGNISINLLLGHLPDDLLEYVAIHELCHILHHNHSKSFWSTVAAHLPDFKSRKKLLHRYGYLLKLS